MLNKLICFIIIVFFTWPAITMAKTAYHIKITGIKGEIYKNVETTLEIEAKNATLKSEKMPQIIRKALEPYGYFKSKIVEINKASFHIDLGEPLRITSVKVQIMGHGHSNAKLVKIMNQFPLKKGMIFNSNNYDEIKKLLFQTANDQGYIKSYFVKNEVKIDLNRDQADIILILDTKDRYYFGKFTFGESPYAPSFLNRFLNFKKKAYFSSKKLYQFQQDMSSTDYFQLVDMEPQLDQIENYKVPVRVSVTPPKSQAYNIGLGYGTFTGPRISTGVTFRRLTDTGHHFNAQLKVSSIISILAGKYFIPGRNPLTDQYVIGGNYQKFSPKNGDSHSKNVSLGYIRKTGHWNNSINLNYLTERYSIENKPFTQSESLYPSLNISYVKKDDLINPHFGYSINFILQGASKTILSSTDFLQAETKAKFLFSPTDNSKILLRGDAGYTVVKNTTDLPLTLRFFAGGVNSIRGYPDSSIGPGKYLAVGSVEYQHTIYGDWSGALFYDIGTVNDHIDQPLKMGEGFGIIYQSVIGPIKMYFAHAKNKPGKSFGFDFSVGPEF